MLTIPQRRVTESATPRGVGFKKKEEPLSAKDLQAKISFIIKDGAQKGYSVDYIAGEIQKMVKENPTAAGKLGLSADFLSLKSMVLPRYRRAKSMAGEEPAGKKLAPAKPPTGTSVLPPTYKPNRKEPVPPREKLPSDYGTKPGQSISGKFAKMEKELTARLEKYNRILERHNLSQQQRRYYEDLRKAMIDDLGELKKGRNSGSRQDKINLYNRLSYEFHLEVKYNVNLTEYGTKWSQEDLQALDEQLALLPKKFVVDSNRLGEIRMEKQDEGKSGHNNEKWISLGPGNITWALIHEIGHNLDNENPKWRQFQALSGWKDVTGKFDKISDDFIADVYEPYKGTARLKRDGKIYKDGDMIDLDGDGKVDGIVQTHYGKVMIYDPDAAFIADSNKGGITNYSYVNPKEDFAETFKYFFTDPKELKKVSPEKFQFMVDYAGYDPTEIVFRPGIRV